MHLKNVQTQTSLPSMPMAHRKNLKVATLFSAITFRSEFQSTDKATQLMRVELEVVCH
jgi:hypothetical protein